MRVPIYDGPQVAERPLQPVLQGPIDASSGTRALGQAIAGLGDTLHDMAQQRAQLQAKQQTAYAALDLAQASNALHDAHDDVNRSVAQGEIAPDLAVGEYRQRASKIVDPTLSGRTPEQAAAMGARFAQLSGTLSRSVQTAADQRRKQDLVGSLDQFGEEMQRVGARDGPAAAVSRYGSMVDFIGPTVGMRPDQMAHLKQKFSENTHANYYQLAGGSAFSNNDDAALGRLVDKLKGKDGEVLDPQRRATLTHELYGWQQAIVAKKLRAQNQADDEARRRYNEAVEVTNKALDLSLSGAVFDKDFISEVTQKAAGTGLEQWANAVMSGQTLLSGFASKPADQREAIVNQLRHTRGTQGTNPLDDRVFSTIETALRKIAEAARDNPWTGAQKVGVIPDAGVMNVGNPSSAAALIQRRMADIPKVERWAGEKVSPLQPQEVEQVQKTLRALPIEQAATTMASFGQSIGDRDRVAALAKQLGDKDGTLGLAMMYASASTSQGRQVAELVLKGDQALKDKSIMVDKAAETGWRGAIAKTIRGAYSNRDLEDGLIDAAFKIAAAKYAESGSVDIPNAVRLATGGIVERNGQRLPLPWGMKEAEFERRIESIKPADLQAQAADGRVMLGNASMPLDAFVQSLPKAALVHAGQGLYNVRAGTSLATNSAGQRITIKVGP